MGLGSDLTTRVRTDERLTLAQRTLSDWKYKNAINLLSYEYVRCLPILVSPVQFSIGPSGLKSVFKDGVRVRFNAYSRNAPYPPLQRSHSGLQIAGGLC